MSKIDCWAEQKIIDAIEKVWHDIKISLQAHEQWEADLLIRIEKDILDNSKRIVTIESLTDKLQRELWELKEDMKKKGFSLLMIWIILWVLSLSVILIALLK